MTTAQLDRPVGALLRQWRERRRLSQLELSNQAEVSTRHLRFVETSRAQPSLARLLTELQGYPCDQPEPDIELPGPGDIVVPLRIRHSGGELSFFSTVATFGTPLDITVAELAIESFFPADPPTADFLRTPR